MTMPGLRRLMKTHYEQLGGTPMASQTAIQQSYLRLIRKLDSDNTPRQAGGRDEAEFLAVQNAYRTLSNLQARAEYDRHVLQSWCPRQKRSNSTTVIAAVAASQG